MDKGSDSTFLYQKASRFWPKHRGKYDTLWLRAYSDCSFFGSLGVARAASAILAAVLDPEQRQSASYIQSASAVLLAKR